MDKIWDERFGSESAVTSRIKLARPGVDDNRQVQRLNRTVCGRGYRFVGEVRRPTRLRSRHAPGRRCARSGPGGQRG